jgi:hypothetical protein
MQSGDAETCNIEGFSMSTSQVHLTAARRAAALLVPAVLLVAPVVAPAAAEQATGANATAQSTTSNTTTRGSADSQSSARTATGSATTDTDDAGTPTQSTPVITNDTLATANQRISNRTTPTAETRAAAEDQRRVDGSDGVMTAAERRALERSLGSMDARLDQLLGSMNRATGADRTEAMVGVIQELVAQVAQLRRLLLATDFGGSGDLGTLGTATGDGQAVFITPSSVAQAEERRQGVFADPAGSTTGAQTTTRRPQPGTTSGTSSLSAQGESRRRGELGEATTTDD